jgi:hypothetical protein
MKKSITVFILALMTISLVSAYDLSDSLARGSEQLIDIVESVLGPFFSVFLGGEGDLLFERILFFFIIFSLVYVVLNSERVPIFQGQKGVIWVITIAVSLLSARFLTDTMLVQTILLPYGVFGVAITSALPLILFFFFAEGFDSPLIRKSLWIFFLVIFMGLWTSRYSELGDVSWIYFITGILALLFFLFDGTIRRAMLRQQFETISSDQRIAKAAKLEEDLGKLDNRRSSYPPTTFRRMRKRLVKQIEDLRKH